MKALDFESLRGKAYESYPSNTTLDTALFYTAKRGHKCIDFSESLWQEDFEDIDAFFKENEVKEFTISSGSNNLMSFLAFFVSNGWRLAGMTKVNYGFDNLERDAIKVSRK